jgi:hypothetical protein
MCEFYRLMGGHQTDIAFHKILRMETNNVPADCMRLTYEFAVSIHRDRSLVGLGPHHGTGSNLALAWAILGPVQLTMPQRFSTLESFWLRDAQSCAGQKVSTKGCA